MIKIYSENDFEKEFIEQLKSEEEIWDFSIEDLDYLLKEHKEEEFVLIDGRLYEKGQFTKEDSKRRYVYNVYNFLNNTRGCVEDYEIIELLKVLNYDKEDSYKVTQEDITYLSNLLMSGDNEEEFYNYLIEKERGTN